MYQRLIYPRLAASRKSLLLLGARQVGKSTLARALGPDVIINLADEPTFLAYAKDAGRLGREVAALARGSCVFIDEIQRLPSLLNTIQALIDAGHQHRFLLTGSSARKLKRGGANLLPGRVVLEHLDPLSVWELGPAFDLDRALTVGTLPGIYADTSSPYDTLETYATVYLREEVQAEALVRDVGSYARFLDLAAEASGQWVNYSKLSSDAEIPKETVRRYYEILEDTLVAFRLSPFAPRRSARHVSQRDRFLIFDVGVRNALLGTLRRRQTTTERGLLFEQLVLLQCLYYVRGHRLPWRVLSYRTDAGAEVDGVIDTGDVLIAIECKLARNVAHADLRGLRSFAAVAHRPVRAFVVFTGDRAQRLADAVTAVPYLEFFLETLPRLARG
jgi:predicted AAA+ superfamily ATPase